MEIVKTAVQNLVKDGKTGIYYARTKVQGQTRYRSLDTKTFTTAKLRLPDKLKEIRESIPTEQPTAGLDAKATFEDIARIYSGQVTNDPRLQPATKEVRLRPITTLRRTWPELADRRRSADTGGMPTWRASAQGGAQGASPRTP